MGWFSSDEDDDAAREAAKDGANFRATCLIAVLGAALFGYATSHSHFCLAAGGYTLGLIAALLIFLGADGRDTLYAAYGRVIDKSRQRTHYEDDSILEDIADYDHLSGAQIAASLVFMAVWLAGVYFILRRY